MSDGAVSSSMVCTGDIKLTIEYFLPVQTIWEDRAAILTINYIARWCLWGGGDPDAMEPSSGSPSMGLLCHLYVHCMILHHKEKGRGL